MDNPDGLGLRRKGSPIMFAIVRDGKALNSLVNRAITAGNKYRELLHQAAVSCLVHAVSNDTGDVRPLNRLFKSLTSNDQQAFRMYVRKATAVVGGLSIEKLVNKQYLEPVVQGAVEAGMTLTFSKGEWHVVTTEQMGDEAKRRRSKFEALVVRDLAPGNDPWVPFFRPNNFATIKLVGDDDILSKLIDLSKELSKGNTQTKEIKVSAKVKAFIDSVAMKAQNMIEFGEHPLVETEETPEEMTDKEKAESAKTLEGRGKPAKKPRNRKPRAEDRPAA